MTIKISFSDTTARKHMKNEEKMSYEELAIDAYRMRTARDSLMLSNANLKVENYELKNGRASAFKEIAEKIKAMPFGGDTIDSLIIWLEKQK